MFYSQKLLIKIMQIVLCCFLMASCSQKTQSLNEANQYQSSPELNSSSQENSSFSNKVNKIREETELIDDSTEKMLNRHKKWFALGIVLFIWLGFQSLTNYNQD